MKNIKILFLSLLIPGTMVFCSEGKQTDHGVFQQINRLIFGKRATVIENNTPVEAVHKGPNYIEGLSPASNAWLDQEERNSNFLLATTTDDVDAMRNFLAQGADVNYQLPNSRATALHIVTGGTGNLAVLSLLIQHNARQDLKDNQGCTAGDYLKKRYGH